MRRFPNAILLRLLAGRMFSTMANACLQSAKRRIEARKLQEERADGQGMRLEVPPVHWRRLRY